MSKAQELVARITEYLTCGGLFNPELMWHIAARDLLVDCRAVLAAEQAQPATTVNECLMCSRGVPRDSTGKEHRVNPGRGETFVGPCTAPSPVISSDWTGHHLHFRPSPDCHLCKGRKDWPVGQPEQARPGRQAQPATTSAPHDDTDDEERLRDALRDMQLNWTRFYNSLPDGEYENLGEMRQASIHAGKALIGEDYGSQDDRLCEGCGHNYTQHTKGASPEKYCRHCPCPEWIEPAPPEQGQAAAPTVDCNAMALDFLKNCAQIFGPTGRIPAPTTQNVQDLIEHVVQLSVQAQPEQAQPAVQESLRMLAQEILKPHWPVVRNMEENEARNKEVVRIIAVLLRVNMWEQPKQALKCNCGEVATEHCNIHGDHIAEQALESEPGARAQEALCGTAGSAITSMNAATHPTAKAVSPSEALLSQPHRRSRKRSEFDTVAEWILYLESLLNKPEENVTVVPDGSCQQRAESEHGGGSLRLDYREWAIKALYVPGFDHHWIPEHYEASLTHTAEVMREVVEAALAAQPKGAQVLAVPQMAVPNSKPFPYEAAQSKGPDAPGQPDGDKR